MIDYEKTLKKFFDEVLKYLEKCAKKAKDEFVQQDVFDATWAVSTIADNPRKYADYNARVEANLEQSSIGKGFRAGTGDNTVYRLYIEVLDNMGKLNSEYSWERENAQKVLLRAQKAIKYKNSTNILKDFYFPFLSSERFAEKGRN